MNAQPINAEFINARALRRQAGHHRGDASGGTTSLYHILNRHPALFVPYRKETTYFSYNYYKGERWYRGLFREMPPACFGLDVSPQYFMDPRSIERVKAFAPDTKVILAIRDPVDWIGSLFFQINKFERKPSFDKFLDGFTVTGARETLHCAFADGYVAQTVQQFREAFGVNLLLYRFEDFRDDPLRILNAIEDFIGVPRHFVGSTLDATKVNAVDQYNWRWLTWLLSRESIISAVEWTLPRPLIRRARTLVDRLTMPSAPSKPKALSADERTLARERLGGDRDFVDGLFSGRPIQLGDGEDPQATGR